MMPIGDLARQDEYDMPGYDPMTGVQLSPQYGEPTVTPSREGMTLPEKYVRLIGGRLADTVMAPGRILNANEPVTTE